ncbi:hypothetical protein [Methylococcus mesophilus]|uniref:hypothetical protein n=1 Tax=Methylococcus mesophilus TaxID=2993564 RepID=UPI00224B7AF4|nr:hypothetical protein [Methylococcus mesophilus]UZR28055.1 hypothetical protein OOT43_15245 [Methylococcus mesophilus]
MNSEHIIPLALGGSNAFCLGVDKDFNARVGSSIDGVLANDFLTSMRRREFDARGHSNTPPTVLLRKSTLGDEQRPIQVTLRGKEEPLVWDAMDKRYLDPDEVSGNKISSQFKIDIHVRKRFLAKVALSAGYFIYGDLFRSHVRHNELRALMNFSASTTRDSFAGFGLRGYDEFSPIEEADAQQKELDSFFCQLINGSCVIAGLGPQNVVFVVGVLGKWIGTLNVPAVTESFPVEREHDLGHVVVLRDGGMTRMSYRQLAADAYGILNQERG